MWRRRRACPHVFKRRAWRHVRCDFSGKIYYPSRSCSIIIIRVMVTTSGVQQNFPNQRIFVCQICSIFSLSLFVFRKILTEWLQAAAAVCEKRSVRWKHPFSHLNFRQSLTLLTCFYHSVSKLNDLGSYSRSVNLVVRVLSKEVAVDRTESGGVHLVLEECVVGDETGKIIFTARNGMLKSSHWFIRKSKLTDSTPEQCSDMVVGSTVELRNAKVNLHNGQMRVVVDKWGLIETNTDKYIAEESIPDHNFSDTQYE